MSFDYLTNAPLDEAKETYLEKLKKAGFGSLRETKSAAECPGRISAKAIYAKISAPHYTASAMDGIALRADSSYGATATTPVILDKDEFTVVDTGDPVPEGCNAVVMIEDVIWEEDGRVKLYASAAPWANIRQIGEDICAGEMILPSYSKISPGAVGAMLAAGVTKADVLKKPLVGIIPTGDEIVEPSEDPKPGDVMEFNSSIFSGMLKDWDCIPVTYPIVKDDPKLIKEALSKALEECDIVLINAGSSAGRDDWTTQCIAELGELIYHGIAIKPGKPAILAIAEGKPILGIPGYPVSGIIVIEEFLKPVIDHWYHRSAEPIPHTKASLAKSVVSSLKYQEYVRVKLAMVQGKMVASPLARGAGMVSSFMKADGMLVIPQGLEGIEAGETVDVKLLRPIEELENTVLAIGSHDPLIDELADMLHAEDPELYLSSTHVGSMGGIMAVKRGESHIAGCHLLDEESGEYNYSYMEKYFPDGGIRLVECVGRTQGIMVAKGNPLGITRFEDLAKPGLRYVNRQKGSGTRVLTDYLVKKYGMDEDKIDGYEREETTHTSVATQIAGGSGDAGMGIYSAAKIYDLDFIPVCTEQYDFIVADFAWDLPQVQKLIEILKSEEFARRIDALGGYTLEHPGEVRRRF
ncbi:MAG: molybdopterin biosynthesis protein [Firmicutes bacterium]|nr:molybdopterin biosynthesis protein [Bacillota bacterium]